MADEKTNDEVAKRTIAIPIVPEEAVEPGDVDGHSLAQALAISQLAQRRDRAPAQRADDELKPLTKPFPPMRERRTGK